MRKLLAFIYGFRSLIFFILLESIAFVWIINSRSFQRSVFMDSSSELTGSLLNSYSQWQRYLDLERQNDHLSTENAYLRSLLKDSYLPLTNNSISVRDTLFSQRYSYLKANVINSSHNKKANYLTLNRGGKHGVKKEMGVIGPSGAIGIVKDVSSNFCVVIPIINPSLSISGELKKSKFFGPVKWNGKDYRHTQLFDIPRYATITKGDTVVTDSRSLAFPNGISIGYVENYNIQEDQNFLTVDILLSSDFSSLNQVYIVKDKYKEEVQLLQQQSQNTD